MGIRDSSPRDELAGDRAQQQLAVTATAVRRMHADGSHLGVIARLHSLARHRDKLAIDSDAEDRSQFMRCLLYTPDAAAERSSVELGGPRIFKKKKPHQ